MEYDYSTSILNIHIPKCLPFAKFHLHNNKTPVFTVKIGEKRENH